MTRDNAYSLRDDPATEDAFQGGGHARTARALARAIRELDKKDAAIGLEGAWGSGKSTIINLTKEILEEKSDEDTSNSKKLNGNETTSTVTKSIRGSARTTGRCKICKIIFESPADLDFKKKKGKKTTWIGCDQSDCNFWAHACCAGLLFTPRKPIEKHTFLCDQHR